MKIAQNQRGSGLLAVVMVVAFLAIAGAVAYRVSNNTQYASTSNTPVSRSTTVPATINSKPDLIRADATLDSTAIDSSVNPNQLDSDLNSL